MSRVLGKNAATKVPRSEPATTREMTLYEAARRLAQASRQEEARQAYEQLLPSAIPPLAALIQNDLAVLSALEGDWDRAHAGFLAALELDHSCAAARENVSALKPTRQSDGGGEETRALVPSEPQPDDRSGKCKVAIVSFLFNWPSTGGGIVHTFELAQFLRRAGYEVQHIYARYMPWGIGTVPEPLPYPSDVLEFTEAAWNADAIQARFRKAVEAFDPDHVIITDSWNFKPLLAHAVQGYPYILRFQALECLCPLNNVRLLFGPEGLAQCGRHQLATPDQCHGCLAQRGHLSGSLHQAERALSGVGTASYDQLLRKAYAEAEAAFVVNPLTAAMVSPYTERVVVSPAGMDPARFPWPWPEEPRVLRTPGRTQLFFAGLVEEAMKGYHVLHEACARLWTKRHDFELVATGNPAGQVDPFTRFVGWLSQADLPPHLRAADVCVVPTIAQEALGRTAVEAMAVGRPVIASRLGGLPSTIAEGATGLLCEAGNVEDLARKLEVLLDHPERRERMGQAGRERFDECFRWDVIIQRDYSPLLQPRRRGVPAVQSSSFSKETRP